MAAKLSAIVVPQAIPAPTPSASAPTKPAPPAPASPVMPTRVVPAPPLQKPPVDNKEDQQIDEPVVKPQNDQTDPN